VSNPVTAVPGNATNLDSKVNYLAGLRLALTTAQKALSNHPTIAMKKQSLSEQLEMVMAVGEVVEQNNLFQSMTPMLQGIFGKVYTAGGITKRQAIERGWQFAKDLAISTKMTGLQIFQANLYAVGLIALKQNNVTNSTGLQGAIEALSTTYARLRPTPNGNPLDYFYGNKLYNHNDFLSIAWSSSPVNSRYYKPTERVTSLGTGSVQDAERQDLVTAIADLTDHFRGQANPMKALQMLDRTFQAATQVTNLHQDSYSFEGSTGVYYYTRGFQRQSSIHDTYFLQDIAELAFDIARVNPTVTAGANPNAEWVETLWEGGSVSSAAVGLSDFFSGFAGEAVSVRRQKMGAALDYAGRLVKVADAVDDPGLDMAILKGDILSHLVNLGGAYAALNPNIQQNITDEWSPLHLALIQSYPNTSQILPSAADYLEVHLNQAGKSFKFMESSTSLLKDFKFNQTFSAAWSNLNWLNSFFTATQPRDYSWLLDNLEGYLPASSMERSLTEGEIQFLRDMFGSSIDYGQVRITKGNIASVGATKVLGNTVHMQDAWGSSSNFQKDGRSLTETGLILLAHEITHVWQYQVGGWAYVQEAAMANLLAAITTGNRDNAYNWQEAHNKGTAWEKWNPEQQGKAVEAYSRAILSVYSGVKGEQLKQANALIVILTPYILKVRNKEGAVTYNSGNKYEFGDGIYIF
jgi:hypothetical protein